MENETVIARRISTNPDPMEPFHISQGIQVGDLVFLSGQASIDEYGKIIGIGDFDSQAEQVFDNLDKLLKKAGSDLQKVIKVTIYLTDMSHFPRIVELRRQYFSKPYPADTIVEVKSLALPELMIEIDAIAILNGEKIDS